jgi:hypothetical protein
MADVMAHRPDAHGADSQADEVYLAELQHSASPLAIPWLMSTVVHATTVITLALWWPTLPRQAPAAAGIGVQLEATFLSSMGTEDGGLSGRFDAPPDGGYYEDDGPATVAEEQFAAELPTADASATGGAPSLDALLSEQPAVELAGVLPAMPGGQATSAMPATAIPGAEPGFGGAESGVRSASALTGEPAPAGRLKGGAALTGVFGLRGEGYKFVYVFDRSGSMDGHGGAPLIAAKNELLNSLRDLGQVHQFQIIFYNEEPRIFNPSGQAGRLVFGTDQNKNLARRFIGSVTASGATRHVEALELALKLGPDVIFFLTDADEPRMTPKELAHIAQMNRGTTINTIEFGTDARSENDNFIARLARQNGGQHVYIDVTRLSSNRR